MPAVSRETFFAFSACFDALSLNEIYAGDIATAAEVFSGTPERIREAVHLAADLLQAGDREGLRRMVHRIKPVFGYVGLPNVLECTQGFEDLCHPEMSEEALTSAFTELQRMMLGAAESVCEEHARMTAHINAIA